MDLKAYMQIDDLRNIAQANNISIPRLRGYGLMSEQEPMPIKEIEEMMRESETDVCHRLCCAVPTWHLGTGCSEYSSRTDHKVAYYLTQITYEDGFKKYDRIRWDRIHGWKRRVLKLEIKKKKKLIQKQFEVWNKYVGRTDVLYIHARMGGDNWSSYGGRELEKQSWFLDKVDDSYDSTYCDIYALIT